MRMICWNVSMSSGTRPVDRERGMFAKWPILLNFFSSLGGDLGLPACVTPAGAPCAEQHHGAQQQKRSAGDAGDRGHRPSGDDPVSQAKDRPAGSGLREAGSSPKRRSSIASSSSQAAVFSSSAPTISTGSRRPATTFVCILARKRISSERR